MNEEDFINSWRRKWTSLCVHRQSRCEKTRSDGALVAGMADIVLASNDNLYVISTKPKQVQSTSIYTAEFLYHLCLLNGHVSTAGLVSLFPWNWRLVNLTGGRWHHDALFILLKSLFACSCCTYLFMYCRPIYPLPETVSEKLMCFGRLRNLERRSSYAGMDQSNAPIMLSSVTGSLRLRACRMRCFIDSQSWGTVSRQSLGVCYYFGSEYQNKAYNGILRTA